MEQGMEPEVRKYLWKIVYTITWGMLWFLINATLGLYLGWAFYTDGKGWLTVLFYAWMLISLVFLIRYFYRTWK
jgi:hypothetical protein